MRHIRKGREPRSLQRHRQVQHATYDNYAEKEQLREALLQEQGHLCCYCMQRISIDRMKIEHWASQEDYPEQQLLYKNLLGACLGGEGKSKRQQHCDTRKGRARITVHPADGKRNCEHYIRYLGDGTIDADEPTIRADLEETLNLNLGWLKTNRKKVVDAVIERLKKKRNQGTWARGELERELELWSRPNEHGKYQEYCQVAVHYIRKKLAQLA
jgi:uncharacterized protein (TIGR02646 family)